MYKGKIDTGPLGGRPPEWTEEVAYALAESMLLWAQEPESCTMLEFLAQEGVSYHTLDLLSKKYKMFGEAYKRALHFIGARREKNGLNGEWHAGMVQKSMPLYCDKTKEWELAIRGLDKTLQDEALQLVVRGVMDQAKQLEKDKEAEDKE